MIWASVKMGWQDKRLLLPSILTVFTNIMFGMIMLVQGAKQLPEMANSGLQEIQTTHGLGHHIPHMARANDLMNFTTLNGPNDPGGVSSFGGLLNSDVAIMASVLVMLWWLTNRFLEGVTTALVYSHLTEGPGKGKFSQACSAVFCSLPALIVLGLVTLVAKKLAGWLRNKRGAGVFGFGFNFLASIVEVFWTLAGHLILPAIVIEGTSFWGGLKRADKIASGNLLTIGFGEVGVDGICRLASWLVYLGGVSGFGFAYYGAHIAMSSPAFIAGALIWAFAVVLVTAISIYIRAAFYTCLYAWAIDAEAVQEAERVRIRPPEPLAAALA